MRRSAILAVVCLSAVFACDDDDDQTNVPSPASYQIIPPSTTIRVGQDSLISLYDYGVRVVRDGTDTIPGPNSTTQRIPRLSYFIEDISIAYVDYNSNGDFGWIRGIKGGTTNLRIVGYGDDITVPIEVTPHPATSVVMRVLSGPAGGLIPLANRRDTGTFYALPTDRLSSRVEGLILVNNDTVYCNYCPIKAAPNGRVQRRVRFYTLDPALATVSNAANPAAQRLSGSTLVNTDTAGYVTVLDTSSTPLGIVMDVPGDGLADTVWVRLKLRPIDTIRVMPDSLDVPATDVDDIGTDRIQYPGSEVLGIATQSGNTNYAVRAEFRAFVRRLPVPPSTSQQDTVALNVRATGGVTVFRPNIPVVTWESALESYALINAAGTIVAPCAFVNGETCHAPTVRSDPPGPVTAAQALAAARDSLAMKCVDNGKRLPGVQQNGSPVGPPILFDGDGVLSFPACPPVGGAPGPNIPMPGAFCTTSSSTDLSSTCTVWLRATATDPATGKTLRDRFRLEVRR
jgi:hypothetical protein